MDIYCASCQEPWDTYHLRHDAIYETDLSDYQIQVWSSLNNKLKSPYREAFQKAGYVFGNSILSLRRCPSCPKDAVENTGKTEAVDILADMLGDDEDGLAAMLEDYESIF